MSTHGTSKQLENVPPTNWERTHLNQNEVHYLPLASIGASMIGITKDAVWISIIDRTAHSVSENISICESILRFSRSTLMLMLVKGAEEVELGASFVVDNFPWSELLRTVFKSSGDYWVEKALDWVATDERNTSLVQMISDATERKELSSRTKQRIRIYLAHLCDSVTRQIAEELTNRHLGVISTNYRSAHPKVFGPDVDLAVKINKGPNNNKKFFFEFKSSVPDTLKGIALQKRHFESSESGGKFFLVCLVSVQKKQIPKLAEIDVPYIEKAVEINRTCECIISLLRSQPNTL